MDSSLFFYCKIKKLIKRETRTLMSKITDFSTAVQTALDNIKADEAGLAKMIQDLKDQIAAGSSNLTPEDQAALDAVLAKANDIAASVPDVPPPPPPQV